jgi:F420-non-reducing hydrogenase small subunit
MSKPKVAFYWCASCGGCEEAVVDLNEDILDVVQAVDIVFWPVALDFKRQDVEAMADGSITVSFINGAIRSSEQYEMVELLRRKSKIVIAFGSCAHLGGIPGLANTFDRAAMLKEAYLESPSVTGGNTTVPQTETIVPEGKLTLPELWNTVKSLDQTIKVDYYLPGCPPPANLIKEAVTTILEGRLPEPGTILAPDIALCEDCPRRETKPDKLIIEQFKRPSQHIIDPDQCILAQGFLCLGSVTRKGCGAVCIEGNMPCTGCMGPTSRVKDFGAKAMSAIASLIDADDEEKITKIIDGMADPVGTFYRYSLPASTIHRSYQKPDGGGAHNGA